MRLLAIILGGLLAVVLVLALAVPFWLGAALEWVGPSFGVTFERYERLGYARFRLDSVVVRRAPVEVRIASIEADTPLLWLGRKLISTPALVRAGEWAVEVTPQEPRKPPRTSRGWVPLRMRLERVADRLDAWLPRAEAGAGVVKWPRGSLQFDSAKWNSRVLVCPEMRYKDFGTRVELAVPAGAPWRARLHSMARDLSAELVAASATIGGEVAWLSQGAELNARFPETGWIPAEASLVAQNWEIPAERVRLGRHYSEITGRARLTWSDGKLDTEVAAVGHPKEGSPAPPLNVDLRGSGDRGGFAVNALEVSLPGVVARLSDPVVIDRGGRLQSGASRFGLEADLAQLPWLEAAGSVVGAGSVSPGREGLVQVAFAWRGENVQVAGAALQQAQVAGRMEWPWIEIEEAVLTAANGDVVRARGGWNFRDREIVRAAASGRIEREMLATWWPNLPEFEAFEFEARGDGRWPTVQHQGRASVAGVRAGQLKPVNATITWQGTGDAADTVAAELSAGETRVTAQGSATSDQLTLTDLAFTRGEAVSFGLIEPVTVRWRPSAGIETLRLRGKDAGVTLAWSAGERHRLTASIEAFRLEWLRDFFEAPAPLTIDSTQLRAEWGEGPAEFGVEALMTLALNGGRAAHISTRLRGDAKGIEVALLRVAEDEADIVNATGHLPIVLRPGGQPRVEIDMDAPFALNALTSENPEFWDQLSRLAGVQIAQPEARARLSGTLAQPRGEARFRAKRIAPNPDRFSWRWPRIEDLDVYFIAEQDGLRLEQFAVAVEGQQVRARGWLPVEGARWRELFREPRRFVRRGELRIEVPDADLAVLAEYFPDYLASKGHAELQLTLSDAEGARGFVRVRDVTLRPLGPLGVIQEVNAEVTFDGRAAIVQSLSGRMGGQAVKLEGRAELPRDRRPQLDFRLTGSNLPFVRRAGLLVRGDLNLTLKTPAAGPPVIGGTVRLRDSLFLADVRSLVPSGTRGSEGRPPYFAVETAPLNEWVLDVAVQGERFLRLRTPVFNGTATARFQLSGPLGEPRATGEAIIDEGVIRLPFASFEVRQGQVRLTSEQVQPQIWVAATTRRYGYDLRMELTGAVSAPQLTFSSSPPLESEQILLLVMTGQPPNDEIATTDRQRVARFGAFFGQSLLGSLSSDPTGADRLTITSGEEVSEQGRETYNIEYRLNDKWSLTGEYDEFDEYYGGVKWRFYEKGGRDRDE